MKKIVVVLAMLMVSSLYAQTMLNYGFGGEYDFSIINDYDSTKSSGLLGMLIPTEVGGPGHTISAGVKGEYGTMLSSGLTLGAEGALTAGLSTKSIFNFSMHLSPVVGYSFVTNKLMQIYVNPVTLSFNPYYFENKTGIYSNNDIGIAQVLDFKTGLSFAFSDMGLRNRTAQGYAIGANMKWGQVRFNSGQKGFVKDLGFGISFYTKNIEFLFAN